MTAGMIFVLWFAAAYVEYKIVSSSPLLQRWFANRIAAILISLAIGFAVGAALGIPNGFVAGAANAIGLATNNFTYPMFDRTQKTYTKTKVWVEEHPQTVSDFKTGIKGVFAFIAALFIALGKIIRWTGMALNFAAHPIEGAKRLAR